MEGEGLVKMKDGDAKRRAWRRIICFYDEDGAVINLGGFQVDTPIVSA